MSDDDEKWGFEESEAVTTNEPPEPEDQLVGRDPDSIVSIVVSPTADVLAVHIARGWKNSVDPRALQTNVLAAANAATITALARQLEPSIP